MKEIIDFYGKYNEEKRLLNPYGQVEFRTTMHYIEKYIAGRKNCSILEVGAATGRYSLALAEMGHTVTAVDLVPYNIGILRQKAERKGITNCVSMVGDALNLKKIPSDSQDIVLLLGPLYHLFSEEDKLKALMEGKRVLKPGGILMAGYIMNEFAVITFGFKEKNALYSQSTAKLDENFHVRNTVEDLFSYERLEDIDLYRDKAGLKRLEIISQDGAANYMRKELNEMSGEMLELFIKYHISVSARPELLGAGCHTLDVLTK